MRKPDVPDTPAALIDMGRLSGIHIGAMPHFPDEAAAGVVGRDDEGVAVIGWLGLPIADHPQPEAINLDVVQDRKPVVDGRARRASYERWLVRARQID
jgi:hypothetical protein